MHSITYLYGKLVSSISIQSLCEHTLSQIFTDITTQDTHTASTTCPYQKWFIKAPKSDAVLNPCLSPPGNGFSGGVSETVACHCHGNVDVASRVVRSESPTAL